MHWTKTGRATWKLHQATVRLAPERHAGSVRLSGPHVNCRLYAGGRFRWGIVWEKGNHDVLVKPTTEAWEPPPRLKARIEEEFQAHLAAEALRGTLKDEKWIATYVPCERCPKVATERLTRRVIEQGTSGFIYEMSAVTEELRGFNRTIRDEHVEALRNAREATLAERQRLVVIEIET